MTPRQGGYKDGPDNMDKKKILIVDDEEDLVATVSFRLEANGYKVVTAFNGIDALAKVKAEKPDLILLDVMMPELDGFETAARLKSDSKTLAIPIIMLTAKSERESTEKALDAGAVDYITKPFNPVVLLNKIKSALR